MKGRFVSPKTIAVICMAAILIFSVVVNTSIAYYVRKKTADNTFSVATLELTVVEDSFPEDEKDRYVVPKSYLNKNPYLVNTGSTDVYAFAKVTVPYEEVLLIADTGENINLPDPSGKQERELFNLFSDDSDALSGEETDGFTDGFSVTDTGSFSYGHNWIFLRSEEDTVNKTHSYLFGYKALLTPKEGHNVTDRLFDRIQLRNIIEGSVGDSVIKKITINAYALQSEELKGNMVIADKENLTKPEIIQLYRIYQNQEG